MRASSLQLQKGTSFDKTSTLVLHTVSRASRRAQSGRACRIERRHAKRQFIDSLPPFSFLQLPISQSNGDNRTQLLLRLRARSRGELRARDSEKRYENVYTAVVELFFSYPLPPLSSPPPLRSTETTTNRRCIAVRSASRPSCALYTCFSL